MRAGRLRHRVTIEHPVETQDSTGEPTKAWRPVADCWAERADLSGRELFEAHQLNAQVTTQFRVRWRSDVDARMRVVSDDVAYSIESVQDPEGRREFLLLLCSRSVN